MKEKAKEAEVKFEFYDEKKFRMMPISEVNDWVRKEKRRYRIRNAKGQIIFKKSFKG